MKSEHLPDAGRQPKSSARLIIAFCFLLFCSFSNRLYAETNPVINSALCFIDMDNNPVYDEDVVLGQITMHSLTIQAGGSISYNDPGSTCGDLSGSSNAPAGNMKFIVINDMEIQAGGSIISHNLDDAGNGGNITIQVGGNFKIDGGLISTKSNSTVAGDGGNIEIDVTGNILLEDGAVIESLSSKFDGGTIDITAEGTFTMQGTPGATIKTKNTSGNGDGGTLNIEATGNIVVQSGSEIDAGSNTGMGGTITITGHSNITIDGEVLSETGGLTGTGCNHAHGGYISINADKTLIIGDNGKVSSLGSDPGADLVHLCGCYVTIYGLIQSTGMGHAIPKTTGGCSEFTHVRPPFRGDKDPNSVAGVEIWSSNTIIIDNTGTHNGEINADLSVGAVGRSWIDILAKGNILINAENTGDFIIHANVGGNNGQGGKVKIKSTNGSITGTGLLIQSNAVGSGFREGGEDTLHAKNDINLLGATIESKGINQGGKIDLRSFGTAPASGSLNMDGTTTLNVSNNGTVTQTACGTIGTANIIGAASVVSATSCGGNPTVLPYVQFCGTTGSLTITKVLLGFTPQNTPANEWTFTISPAIGGISTFTIDKSGGDTVFTNVPAGIYTITEELQPDPSCVDGSKYGVQNSCGSGNVAVIDLSSGCSESNCTFTNTPPDCNRDPECQWCTKGAVLSQVWQNPGGMDPTQRCKVPDILVDVRMAHGGANDVVDASEIGTGVPATWSIQAAIDYANAHVGEAAFITDEIFIGVTATDPVAIDPLDPNSCGQTCGRPYAGDSPWGVENVIVTNLSTERMNIFGCSVTMKPADASLPVFTVQNSVGKVTILDLHVKNSSTGYLVKGNGSGNADLVVIKNGSAWYNGIGYDVQDDKVEITGAQHINGNGIGILVSGTNVKLRTNKDIINNSIAGVKITGNGNESNGSEAGAKNNPNAVGIWVTGNNNNLHDDDASYNTTNGIYVTGNNNTLRGEDANNNSQYGMLVMGSGNKLDGNTADENGRQGIRACGQVDEGGNDGEDNLEDPQVQFLCIDPATAKFAVVDISTDKSYKYDASFNLISATSLSANNGDGNDEVSSGGNTYVLDKSDKQVYRYIGGNAVSKVLKSSGGGSLSSPSGMAIDGDQLWIVDGSTKIIYRYSLAAAFAGGGNISALQQITLTGNNGNAEGLAIDATYLYVLDNSDKQFYRYPRAGGAGVASKVMKDPGGSSIGNPTGAVLDAGWMWIVDDSKDKAYKYNFALLMGAGNLNATSQFALAGANGSAKGIAAGTNATLLRTNSSELENLPVTESLSREIAPRAATEIKDLYLQVYPNPAHENVLVRFSNSAITKYTLKLVDMAGRTVMVYSGVTTDGYTIHNFNVHHLARGTYQLVLQKAGKKNEVKKIVIN